MNRREDIPPDAVELCSLRPEHHPGSRRRLADTPDNHENRCGRVSRWWTAIRPRTLPVAVAPVVVGAALSTQVSAVSWYAVVLALIGSILLTIGANLANDLFDFENGADTATRVGPLRVTQAGWFTPAQMRVAMTIVFALAAVNGAILASIGGLPIVILGITSIIAAIMYTGGPWPLGYHGFGELLVFVFYGPVAVGGTVWVAAGTLPYLTWLVAIPLGLLATAVLLVNNIRDVETDEQAGKHTLIVRTGRDFGVWFYGFCFVVAVAIPSLMWLGKLNSWTILFPCVLIPRMYRLTHTIKHSTDGPTLNLALASTAKVLVGYAGLLSAGLML